MTGTASLRIGFLPEDPLVSGMVPESLDTSLDKSLDKSLEISPGTLPDTLPGTTVERPVERSVESTGAQSVTQTVTQTVAAWQFREWGHLSGSLPERLAALRAQGGRVTVPCTLVAWQGETPVGAASLILDDLPTHPQWNPWLASVVVVPRLRGTGIGSALCRAAAQAAEAQGLPRLYLFTTDQVGYYARMGWGSLETLRHRGEAVTVMALDLNS